MMRSERPKDWRPGWQSPDEPWDGTDFRERQEAEAADLDARKEALRDEERAAAAAKRAEAKAKRDEARAKERAKQSALDRKHGVFSAVTRVDEDGNRHCTRCDGTDFVKKRKEGKTGEAIGRGGLTAALLGGAIALPFAALGAARAWQLLEEGAIMLCQSCGAVYPITRAK